MIHSGSQSNKGIQPLSINTCQSCAALKERKKPSYLLLHPLSGSPLGHYHFGACIEHHPWCIWKNKTETKLQCPLRPWITFANYCRTSFAKQNTQISWKKKSVGHDYERQSHCGRFGLIKHEQHSHLRLFKHHHAIPVTGKLQACLNNAEIPALADCDG